MRWADEYNTTFASEDDIRALRQKLDDECERVGREPLRLTLMSTTLVGGDENSCATARALPRACGGRRAGRVARRAARLAPHRNRAGVDRVARPLRRGGAGRRVPPASRPRRPRHGAPDRRGDRPGRFVRLAGAVCLVTGASAGIGRATVDALMARARASRWRAGRRAARGRRRAPARVDLAEPADLADEVGPVDVLVNSAASAGRGRSRRRRSRAARGGQPRCADRAGAIVRPGDGGGGRVTSSTCPRSPATSGRARKPSTRRRKAA